MAADARPICTTATRHDPADLRYARPLFQAACDWGAWWPSTSCAVPAGQWRRRGRGRDRGRVLGHQIGSGRGNDAATVAGAVGGALAGNEIERRHNDDEHYRVTVQLRDGREASFIQDSPNGLRVGDRVRVADNRLYRD